MLKLIQCVTGLTIFFDAPDTMSQSVADTQTSFVLPSTGIHPSMKPL